MLRDMASGLTDETVVKFVGFDGNVTMKDGVYFYSMTVLAKPLKREDINERRVLIERTIPRPAFVEGRKLKIRTHANILTAYAPIE
jgi:hypothetical protein